MSHQEIINYLKRNLYSENGVHIDINSRFRVYSGDLQKDKIKKKYRSNFQNIQ